MRRCARGYALVWVAAVLVTFVLMPRDAAVLGAVQDAGAAWQGWAGPISTVGRFENSSLAFALVLAVGGLLMRSDRWRDAAVACLLAGLIAGLAVNVFRPTIGRARPHAEAAPGFYGFELDADFHSLPSGHASTNVATALGVLRVLPVVGVPLVAFAASVVWSRMQLNRHYPTDVLWGAVLGGSIGWAVGGAIVDRRRSARSR